MGNSTKQTNWLLHTLLILGVFLVVAAYFNKVSAVNSVNFFWRAEDVTLDGTHDFSVGDTTATLISTADTVPGAAHIGTNGLDIPSSNDSAQFAISSGDLISPGTGAIAFWFRMVTFTGASMFNANINATPNTNITILQNGTDDATGREILLRNRLNGVSNVTLFTTDADLALNTWYFVVARYDEPNNDRRIEIYNEDGSLRGTPAEDLNTNFDQATGMDTLRIGEVGGSSIDVHLDNIFIADDYNEPLEDKMNITSWTEYESSATTPIRVKGGVRIKGGVNFR